LDIQFFSPGNNTNNMWVEYQVALTETRPYTLALQYSASTAMTFAVSVNGEAAKNITLPASSAWATHTDTLDLSAGLHTIRFRKATTSGTAEINWLKLE
jgi:hypothetical protein